MSEINENNKCVYVHKDKEGVVRYVGSGTIQRAYTTCANSCRGKKYSEYVEVNGKLEVEIVAEGLSKIEAEDLERELYDKNKGSILNHNRPSSVKIISKEIFDEFLYYDETSKSCLRWKVDRVSANGGVKMRAGSEAGSLSKTSGYYIINIQRKLYRAHRIIAVLHNIDVDAKVIDHIDRNRANNKISNLRVVSQKDNSQNKNLAKISSSNISGVQGVHYEKRRNYWVAGWREECKWKQKYFPIKNYTSSQEAFAAACEHREKMVKLHYNKDNHAIHTTN